MQEVLSPREIYGPELRESRRFSLDRSLADTLAVYGLGVSDAVVPSLVVPANERLVLAEVATPVVRKTADIAQYKEWIGLENALIDEAALEGLPALPRHAWPQGRTPTTLDDLSAAELADVQAAANTYLWGDSRLVRSYKEALDLFYGPFEVDVYVIDRLVIEPGASLIVADRPTALLCNAIELHDSGALKLYSITRMWVQTLNKLSIVH